MTNINIDVAVNNTSTKLSSVDVTHRIEQIYRGKVNCRVDDNVLRKKMVMREDIENEI